MEYIYIKKAYNHNSLPLKLGEKYKIKKDNRFKECYIITNYGLIISGYCLSTCFECVKN